MHLLYLWFYILNCINGDTWSQQMQKKENGRKWKIWKVESSQVINQQVYIYTLYIHTHMLTYEKNAERQTGAPEVL